MTWVKLDDGVFRNQKVRRAGPPATLLYLAALCHCQAGLTDGLVVDEALPVLAAEAWVADAAAAVARLCEVGLWERVRGGYRVHDYLAYNPAAADVKARLAEDRERKARERANGSTTAAEMRRGVRETSGRTNFGHTPEYGRSPVGSPSRIPSYPAHPGRSPSGTHPGPSGDEAPAPAGADDARARAGGPADDDSGRSLSDAMDPLTVDAARAVWQPVSERLRGEMHARNWGLYIQPCVALGIADDGALLLSTANPLLLEQAPQFRQQMLRALADIPDAPRDVRLVPGP
jgi:hypothetical protein